MAMRAALHKAGACALRQLLRCDPPGAQERERPCPCGQKARYREMRARQVLTVVGREFRKLHLLVGSGVIEAACKSVVGHRLKQSGMFWTLHGVNSILALRCSHLKGRFEDYWESRQPA